MTHADQIWFATASGDFNPIHVDPVYARRTVYGRQVVHGIHLLIASLDAADSDMDVAERVTGVVARFSNAAFLDEDFLLSTERTEDGLRLQLTRNGDSLMTAEVALAAGGREPSVPSVQSFSPDQPTVRQPGEAAEVRGTQPLDYDVDSVRERYGRAVTRAGEDLVGLWMAGTRLVGMEVPGLHSLIVEVRSESAEGAGGDTVEYAADVTPIKVRPVDVQLTSGDLSGRIRTMFRPAPVDQPAYTWFESQYAGPDLSGWKAWVLGGSRGIGEALAKHLAAGGADVTVTYARGARDAERVAREIRDGGGSATARRLDVLADGWASEVASLGPTHVFHLASPKILPRDPNSGSAAPAFAEYVDFYVTGLFRLAEALLQENGAGRIYFPSSVYVEDEKAGFADYAAAKRLAEALGDDLTFRHESVHVAYSRLPEILTDQTARILPGRSRPASDFVADIVSLLR